MKKGKVLSGNLDTYGSFFYFSSTDRMGTITDLKKSTVCNVECSKNSMKVMNPEKFLKFLKLELNF